MIGKALFPLPEMLDEEDTPLIETRFGRIALQKHNAFSFKRGLLGMPEKQDFFLTDFPNEKLRKFKLLQSLSDFSLSFITLPLLVQNAIIAPEDLQLASSELGIRPEDLVILLMVSVHRTVHKVSISVNAKAPLLIDARQKLAAQYVFRNDRYSVQHFLS